MKARSCVLFISLVLTAVADNLSVETTTESHAFPKDSAVHGRIMELLKQDAKMTPLKPKEAVAPFLNPDAVAANPPVEEGVLELEPITVTKKKPIELPPRIDRVTLANFFYGDGTIAERADKHISLSAGPEERGLAALKLNIKF